jgi:hypothetical protein
MTTYDPYTKYHGKINLAKLVPKYHPLTPLYKKEDLNRLSHMHVRKASLKALDLTSDTMNGRYVPLPPDFKNIVELSCRCPYCPIAFNLDTIGGSCAYNCVTGDTIVRTDKDLKLIKNLSIGDKVMSYEEGTDYHSRVYSTVTMGHHQTSPVLKLKLTNKKSLRVTADHLIFTKFGWIPAGKLSTKDCILTADSWAKVWEITPDGEDTVYDIQCEPYHNFFANGILVHNCRYCFTSLTFSSIATSFFDSDNPTAPRSASIQHVRENLTEIIEARGVQPSERTGKGETCGTITDPPSLKKAAAQRVPLKFGARNENFQPIEKIKGASLEALKILRDHDYPFVLNTKSDLIIQGEYLKVISECQNIGVQVTIIHDNDEFVKKLEPGAPSSTARFNVLKTLSQMGIKTVARMEPAAAFLNNDDAFLQRYFDKLQEAGVKNFMGDPWHNTVKAEEIRKMFYAIDVDFDRMFWATSDYQILGSYVWEKAMYYAKQHGMRSAAFNFHTLPWNDEVVCCLVGDQFGTWSKYSLVHWLKQDLINERRSMSFADFDCKYYGLELHPAIRDRLRRVMNLELDSAWNPDFCEGLYVSGKDSEGNLIWSFDPDRMGRGYEKIIEMTK